MEPNIYPNANFIGRLKAHRYRSMLDYLSTNNCTNILEIGTNHGYTASELIKHSKNKKVNYHGIDIFLEGWTREIELKEQSIPPNSKKLVSKYLQNLDNTKQYTVTLHQGLSSEMLPKLNDSDIKFDLVWIDGGHSYETVKLDFEYSFKMLNEGGIIFFDDYTTEPTYPPDNPIPLGVKPFIDDLIKEDKYDIKILNNYVDNYRGHHYKIASLQKRK